MFMQTFQFNMTTVIVTTFEGAAAVSDDNLLTLFKRGQVATWQEDGWNKFTDGNCF